MVKSDKYTLKGWDWKKFLMGMKRPIIALLGYGLGVLAGQPQWAWVSGIGAERLWMTIEYYLAE